MLQSAILRPRYVLVTLIVGLLVAAGVAPATDSPLQGEMRVFRIEPDAGGGDKRVATDRIKPGQVIEYVLDYVNASDDTLTNLNLTGPVPANTRYVPASALQRPDLLPQFSIDGGLVFKPEPVTYTVTLEDGTREQRVATPDMYTHVRWKLARLAPGEAIALTYRVTVE